MNIPFFEEVLPAQTVLLAGAGGGFDVFAALPLYFWLRQMGKTVHLANLSFTELDECLGERPCPEILKVTAQTRGPSQYFPELALALWLESRWGEIPVYAIRREGVQPVARAYRWLVDSLQPDTVILVDGGTDILMRGDEAGLGTPQEDVASLLAAADTPVERKFLLCLGFGIDAHHGVCHAQVLENISALIDEGGYLGAWSLTYDQEEVKLYQDALVFATHRMPRHPSIVNSSILAALAGWFGDRHPTNRTRGSRLFINPLMGLYWSFQLEAVAARLLYRSEVWESESYMQLSLAIERYRDMLLKTRPRTSIPH